jgi:uncharacterized membrane protein YhaH (DUF805 family)
MNWYYMNGDKQEGPLEQEAMMTLIKSGRINSTTPVWNESMQEWIPLSQTELSSHASAKVPPPFTGMSTPPPPAMGKAAYANPTPSMAYPVNPANNSCCPSCGQQILSGTRFCSKCGAPACTSYAQPQSANYAAPVNNTGMRDSMSSGGSPNGIEWCFVALKKYAVFTGRARRMEFWMFYLFYTASYILAVILDAMGGCGIFSSLVVLGSLLPFLGVGIRRMHDTNRSGWFCLIPIANIFFAAEKGTIGPNRFGPDPLQVQGGMP